MLAGSPTAVACCSSLGVDAGVKVEYRSLGRAMSSVGVFTRCDVATHKFLTVVKNTKAVPLTLVIADQASGAPLPLLRSCSFPR